MEEEYDSFDESDIPPPPPPEEEDEFDEELLNSKGFIENWWQFLRLIQVALFSSLSSGSSDSKDV